jgi:AcrR family transcriptional regulator
LIKGDFVIGLLGLGVRDLAAAANVSAGAIIRLERGEALMTRALAAVVEALESAGVDFIAKNGGGPGVRLRKMPLS